MPEDLKDIDARLHALQQFLKQVRWSLPPPLAHHTTQRALRSGCRPSRSRAWVDSKWLVCVRRLHSMYVAQAAAATSAAHRDGAGVTFIKAGAFIHHSSPHTCSYRRDGACVDNINKTSHTHRGSSHCRYRHGRSSHCRLVDNAAMASICAP